MEVVNPGNSGIFRSENMNKNLAERSLSGGKRSYCPLYFRWVCLAGFHVVIRQPWGHLLSSLDALS